MALARLADRVKETSSTIGTGVFSLEGEYTGYQTFLETVGSGSVTYYCIAHDQADEWEVGIGTVGDNSLFRDVILASSNGGSLVSFTRGTKDIFVTYPAEKHVSLDTNDNLILSGSTIEASLFSGSFGGNVESTGSLTGSFKGESYATGSLTGSFRGLGVITGSLSGSVVGHSDTTGSFSGSAIVTGSLVGIVTGSMSGSIIATGKLIGVVTGSMTGSLSGSVSGSSGSFSVVNVLNLFNGGNQILDSNRNLLNVKISGSLLVGSGSLADTMLTSNVPLKNTANVFTARQRVSGSAASISRAFEVNVSDSGTEFGILDVLRAGARKWAYVNGTTDIYTFYRLTGTAGSETATKVYDVSNSTGVVDFTSTPTVSSTAVSLNGHTHTFASLTSKPTTLSGYGITDAVSTNTGLTSITAPGSFGSFTTTGTTGGYSGIYFASAGLYLMITATTQGFYNGSTWSWYFSSGVLTTGTVPWSQLTSIPSYASRWPAFSEVTGTLTVSQISATGTASSATFLRGDGAWTDVSMTGHAVYRSTDQTLVADESWQTIKFDTTEFGSGIVNLSTGVGTIVTTGLYAVQYLVKRNVLSGAQDTRLLINGSVIINPAVDSDRWQLTTWIGNLTASATVTVQAKDNTSGIVIAGGITVCVLRIFRLSGAL
jgi:hypothetical protein